VTALTANPWLIVGGCLSLFASLMHIAIIFGGPNWYRFFGAGERFASEAQAGSWVPPLVTLGIATVLAVWAAYAFSGAGWLPQLPLMRAALLAITAIYLLRAFALLPALAFRPALVTPFIVWSSLIVLIYGLVYAMGTYRAWSNLPALG
jgi:hypothetical protein